MIETKLYGCLIHFLSGVYWSIKRLKNYLRSVWLALNLPGPRALPVLGNALTITDTDALVKIATNISQLYAPLCRTWMFFLPIIIVYEPEDLKAILSNTKVSDKNFFYSVMHTFIGDGLITSTGSKWRKHRKLIQPLFQNNLLEGYLETFTEMSSKMLEELCKGPDTLGITKSINTAILNILHKAILGVTLTSEQETPFRRGELLIIKRVLKPWLLFESIFKHSQMSRDESRQFDNLHSYIRKIFNERLAQRKDKLRKTTCLLDQLMELPELSPEDIFNEAVTFMLAGQDSVGATVAFALFQLAKNPEVQEKVHKEISEFFYSDQITMTQLNQMIYLEQCIKETLRLLPSIPLISRVLTSDISLGKHTIPCGTDIFISPFATHRLPHFFPEPLKFDPERFRSDKLKKMHPYSFLPFSSGPRNCIGFKFAYFQMKVLIASIVKNYSIALRDGCQDLKLAYRVTLRAKGGIWLTIQPRKKRYVD
ncbi:probable cytochrome P450 4aa1 [Euwallacea similis]|uniref:probable cytochrome P450 4aa1 n=1 Tax=Euwallacea similis TaxID=1736056 RepID=UPI00344E63A3